jgi:hypothetical protein
MPQMRKDNSADPAGVRRSRPPRHPQVIDHVRASVPATRPGADGGGVVPITSLAGETTGPLLPALRDGDRFATGLEHGVTLAFVCWVLPLEPDDFAPAGVVIQSNPGSK